MNMSSTEFLKTDPSVYAPDMLRLEAVTVCVGFDDMLDATLTLNHPHLDHVIVVTSHADKATQACCRKHNATCVQTDLFRKDGRNFNKGAAINAGFDYFRFHGWRIHMDSDIALPDNFRRLLFNHTHLDPGTIYGCDRVNVVGKDNVKKLLTQRDHQLVNRLCLGTGRGGMGHRLVCQLRGYLPVGFFQMWHAKAQKPYPYSLGTAAHDDMMFSALWPEANRRHLPTAIVYHLCAAPPRIGENWEGKRRQPRIDGK